MAIINLNQAIKINSLKMGSITNAIGILENFDQNISKYLSNNRSNSTISFTSVNSVFQNFNTHSVFKNGKFKGGISAALKDRSFNVIGANRGLNSALQSSKTFFTLDEERIQECFRERIFVDNSKSINKANINISPNYSVVLGKISIEHIKKLLNLK